MSPLTDSIVKSTYLPSDMDKCFVEYIAKNGDSYALCRRRTFAESYHGLRKLPQIALVAYLKKRGVEDPAWVVGIYTSDQNYPSGIVIDNLSFTQALGFGQLHF